VREHRNARYATTTVINKNYITRPVVERIIEHGQVLGASAGFVTLNDLAQLEARVDAKLRSFQTPPPNPEQVAAGGVPGSYGSPPPAAYRIDNLNGVTIHNATIIGGSVSDVSGVGGGSIGSNATTTSFFSSVGHFTTGIIDALSSAAGTITNLDSTDLVATNATTTNLYVSGTAAIDSGTGVVQESNGVVYVVSDSAGLTSTSTRTVIVAASLAANDNQASSTSPAANDNSTVPLAATGTD
jgi:hypothetical protein